MAAERRLRFDRFELVPETGELFRDGERVPLQHQPAQLLALLAGRAGQAVSREEIRDAIWGRESWVEYDQSINYCIRQIRQALGDDPAAPRFVETVPRHGYRFVAPVEERSAEPVPSAPLPATPPASEAPEAGAGAARLRARPLVVAAGALLVLVVAIGLRVANRPAGPSEGEGREAIGPVSSGAPPSQIVVPEETRARYLEARYLLDRSTPNDHVDAATEAIGLLDAVIAEVPRYAEAHAVLADAWMLRFDLPRAEAMEHAEDEARAALAIDPDLAVAHTVLASALLFHRLDWKGAREHVDRALDLDPASPDAVFLAAILDSTLGEHDAAIAGARRAATLDPSQLPGLSIAWFYYFARRFDDAAVEARRVIELEPTDEPSHQVLVLALLAKGDEPAADAEVDRFFAARFYPPGVPAEDVVGARELYRTYWEHRDDEVPGQNSPMVHATQAVVAGEPEGAIDSLLEACRGRLATWDLPFVAVDPRWDTLRERPRFREVLSCVGVPGKGGARLEAPEG